MITAAEATDIFINTRLEEDYNFLQADLVKLANAFIAHAAPKIAAEERNECLKVVRSLNSVVADKLQEIRGR